MMDLEDNFFVGFLPKKVVVLIYWTTAVQVCRCKNYSNF